MHRQPSAMHRQPSAMHRQPSAMHRQLSATRTQVRNVRATSLCLESDQFQRRSESCKIPATHHELEVEVQHAISHPNPKRRAITPMSESPNGLIEYLTNADVYAPEPL